MVTYYCTEAEVIQQIGLIDASTGDLLTTSSSTFPTTDMITFFINNAESWIDRETWNSWRAKSTNGYEYYDPYSQNANNDYRWDFISVNGIYAIPIKLNHNHIRTPVSGTDYFEYFDGDNWIDLISTKTKGDGFGEGDYWIDEEQGIVYLFTLIPTIGRSTFRAKYRYGYSTVPEDIREATAKRAAIDILDSDWFKRSFPDAGTHPSIDSQINRWEKTIDRILGNYKTVQFIF